MKNKRIITCIIAIVIFITCAVPSVSFSAVHASAYTEQMPWDKEGSKQPEDYTWEEFEALTPVQQEYFLDSFTGDGFMRWYKTAMQNTMPWSKPGAKQPKDYTWEEFQALTSEQSEFFQDSFSSPAEFQKWMDKAIEVSLPWKKAGAKQPKDYSLAEFESLTPMQQEYFQDSFTGDGFTRWYKTAKQNTMPWSKPGAKQPKDYTWEEYQALTPEQSEFFQDSFSSPAEFQKWMDKAIEASLPWKKAGAKQPKDYSLAEFEALTPMQQEYFQNSFTGDGFMRWYKTAMQNTMPWAKPGAKQPKDYTWEEFQALTSEQSEFFQDSFSSPAEFQKWMDKAIEASLPWKKAGAKQPKDYSLAEFEALTPMQQEYFQDSFTGDGFIKWYKTAMQNTMPWAKPGAKQPKDYTWEEFQALTSEQSEFFQDSFSSPAEFQKWMDKAIEASLPWKKAGAKQPKDYSLAEFEALTPMQQEYFQDSFTGDGFIKWYKTAMQNTMPWAKPGAKQPKDYTWEEFQALTSEQSEFFQDSFSSPAEFQKWMDKAIEASLPWKKAGAKQPKDYSLAEFEALTPMQQEYFQDSFTGDGFIKWYKTAVQDTMPWSKPGAKQPKDYTWEEYQALTREQAEFFHDYFASDSEFEAWMKKAKSNAGNDCASGVHASTKTEKRDATCTETGYERVVCTACGKILSDKKIPARSHSYVSKIVAPTCTAEGYTLHECKNCGNTYTDTKRSALGHKWSEWRVILQPTNTTEGQRVRSCTNSGCNATQNESIPKIGSLTFDDVLAEIETGFRPTEKITDDGAIKMLCGFNEKSEVSKYRTLFGSRYNIKLLNAKGKEKTTGYMATGDVYALYDSKGNIVDKLIVIVNGDVNGDGKVNAADYIAQRRHILGIIRLDTPYFTAADVNGNGKVQANDYIKLRRFLLGFINTLD